MLIREQGHDHRVIEIGPDVWVGASATIIASIGEGAVVGANSVVTRPVPARAVVAGTPARILRRRGEDAPAITMGI
jgi:acetyltransferase-like isoleucine patch superfamily enzyme